MKTVVLIGVGVVTVVALVIAGLAVGWALWGQPLWATEMPAYGQGQDSRFTDSYCSSRSYSRGPGMMGRRSAAPAQCPAWGGETPKDQDAAPSADLTLEEAHEAVERYLTAQGYPDLEVAEVMEFEHNFYAIAREPDTGVGAMELLIDKETGTVAPEMGPNRMWNARYGMHGGRGMMGTAGETNSISPEEAANIAQRWLDAKRPGLTVEQHADPFYGYYTLHTQEEGRIAGMLSVHGRTGEVWYHTWHGAFVQMMEQEDDH